MELFVLVNRIRVAHSVLKQDTKWCIKMVAGERGLKYLKDYVIFLFSVGIYEQIDAPRNSKN